MGIRSIRRKALAAATSALAVAAFVMLTAGPAAAATPTPPFTQCPAIGADTSCAILIVVNQGGTLEAFRDPSQGPFDGIEDTLIGIQNNSGSPVKSISLTGTNIFGFEGDGLCSGRNESEKEGFVPPPEGCPFGPTGYEGPGTAFTISNVNEGTVEFGEAGLAAGASTYFSLEEAIEAFTCKETTCEVIETPRCKEARGVGHAGPIGPEGLNEDNNLNTGLTGVETFEFTLPNKEHHFHLSHLNSASCVAVTGGHVFSGQGTGKLDRVPGYEVSFSIEQTEASVQYFCLEAPTNLRQTIPDVLNLSMEHHHARHAPGST